MNRTPFAIPGRAGYLALCFCLTACTSIPPELIVRDGPCETEFATLDADFPAAGMAACAPLNNTTFVVFIEPEDPPPINPSPWYAFRLTPKQSGMATIKIRYQGADHRYRPKISTDSGAYSLLSRANVNDSRGNRVHLKVPLEDRPVFVSAQELMDNDWYAQWAAKLVERTGIAAHTIGHSTEGREIKMLQSPASSGGKKAVLLVGRQHPPELTGAQAMAAFVTRLFYDDELANDFRREHNLFIVPNMNPDGVEHGHWRHNLGSIDLNRDWGPFTQPETRAIKLLLDRLDDEGYQQVLFLDFHSTKRNVFYTQTKTDEPTAYDFTGQWIKRGNERLSGYDAERAERHNSDLPTSKNYMFTRYRIPAITYELGDQTDRALIKQSAQVFAEEMMKLLNAHG